MNKHSRTLLAAAGLASIVAAGLGQPAAAAPPAGPTTTATARYILQTRAGTSPSDLARQVRRSGGDVEHVYSSVLPGLSAALTAAQVQNLRADRDVTSVVPDQVFHSTATQTKPVWGLDRIDQRATKGTGSYGYRSTGSGVTAFVLDTGLRFRHTQFGGRAYSGIDFVDYDDDAADCQGHGTHVAGTVGGSTYGVAKKVTLVAARVLDCDGAGYASDIIEALDWVVAVKDGPAVVNLSLGGAAYKPLDDAVERTVRAGVPVVVAAGNDAGDACQQSPARAPHAITVAATDIKDHRAWFSDYGRCVDLFAPGVNIRSASNRSNTATEVLSGTSMAAPHVTGVVARYLQTHPSSTPAQTTAALVRTATTAHVRDRAGSANRLLYAAR